MYKIFTLNLGEDEAILTYTNVSDGLVQPPTSYSKGAGVFFLPWRAGSKDGRLIDVLLRITIFRQV